MSPIVDAIVLDWNVICSRCGAPMTPEQFWGQDNEMMPFLFWRCDEGHITQAIPLPSNVANKSARTPNPAL